MNVNQGGLYKLTGNGTLELVHRTVPLPEEEAAPELDASLITETAAPETPPKSKLKKEAPADAGADTNTTGDK